jgi:hypothetical protein
MRDSRAQIFAALQTVGGHDLATIASETLALAGCEPGGDPNRIAGRLPYELRWVDVAAQRAWFDGRTIKVLFTPGEWALNALIGISRAVDATRRLRLTPGEVYKLAGHLAMPGIDRCDIAPSLEYLPTWFVQALRRRISSGYGSGVWVAVGRLAVVR